LTCPLTFGEAPVTPKKKINQGEQLLDDSDSALEDGEELKEDSDDSGSNEEEDSDGNDAEKEAEQEAAKIDEMKRYAEDNGIQLIFEKKEEPKKKDDDEPWKMTPELLAKLQIEDDRRFMEKMKKYIPPPLEILKKQYTTDEPVRTGFNQGLLPIKIKNNFEHGRVQ